MKKQFSRCGKWLVTIAFLVIQVPAWGAYTTAQEQTSNSTQLRATYAGAYGAAISFARYAQPGKSRYATRSPVPEGIMLRIRLQTGLTTKYSREGDQFAARVIEPREYKGAIIQGHVVKLDRSGQITGRTEMALDFDTIKLRNGRSGPFDAQIERVFATESVKSVDEEGNVESASKTKETEIRTIGGAVLGAIIGGIAGGGKGAAIGAIIGAGAGAGSVYVQGRKDLILEPGTQMIVRTTGPHRERAAR